MDIDSSVFRGRHASGGWLYGQLYVYFDLSYILPFYNYDPAFMYTEMDEFEVEHHTVGQHTGLFETVGTLGGIFDGDILRGNNNDYDISVVKFGEYDVVDPRTLEVVDTARGWYTHSLNPQDVIYQDIPLTSFYNEQAGYEKIGNVYDNPEYLTGNYKPGKWRANQELMKELLESIKKEDYL